MWGGLGLSALAFWPMGWMGFTLAKLILLHLGLGMACLSLLFERRSNFGVRPWTLWIVVAYFALLGVYTLFSPAPLTSFFGVTESSQGFLTQLIYLTIFLLGLSVSEEEKAWGFKMLFLVNLLVVLYSFLQVLGLDPIAWDSESYLGRTFSTLGHPDWLGVWLLLTLPVVCRTQRWRWFWIVLQVLALILTASKAAFLGLGVFVLGVLIFQKGQRGKVFLGAIMAVLLFAAVLMRLYPDNFFLFRSLEARSVIWSNSVQMIKENPLGYGVEMFSYFYPRFSTVDLWEYEAFGATIEHPHNQFLELWITVGPLGILLFYGLVLAILVPHLRKENSLLALGIFSFLVAQFFGFETVATGALFWLFLGILARQKDRTTKDFKILLIILAVINLFAVGVRWSQMQSNFIWDRVSILESSSEMLDREVLSREEVQKVETLLDRGVRLSGNEDAETILLQALLAARRGDAEDAKKLYKIGRAKNPYHPRTYFIGMKIFDYIKDPEAKKEAITDLQSLLPSFWNHPETEPGRIFQKNNPWIKSGIIE